MLYTDATWISTADLAQADSDAVDVANSEETDLTTLLVRTLAECGQEILSALQNFTMAGSPGLTAVHLSAVLGDSSLSPRARLGQIVAHSLSPGLDSPLKVWVVARALLALYTEVHSRQLNNRYEPRLLKFDRMAVDAWLRFTRAGIPIVASPLPCPGAQNEPEMGIWNIDNLSGSAGGSEDKDVFQVAITYTGSGYTSATAKGNAESGPSKVLRYTLEASKWLKVDISSLTAPDGSLAVGTSQGPWVNMAATGWNVYIGQNDLLYLQNSSPIDIATTSYTLAAAPTLSGDLLGDGQYPDRNLQPALSVIHRM